MADSYRLRYREASGVTFRLNQYNSAGLVVRAAIDHRRYPTGQKVTPKQMREVIVGEALEDRALDVVDGNEPLRHQARDVNFDLPVDVTGLFAVAHARLVTSCTLVSKDRDHGRRTEVLLRR